MRAQSLKATGLRLRAYISGKSRLPMLQVICITFGTLKICPSLKPGAHLLYMAMDAHYDCNTLS